MSEKKCYYEILGVEKDADVKEIKKAYRKLAMKWHPDRNQDNLEEAQNKMAEYTEANDVLTDEKKRSCYDSFGHAGLNGDYSNLGGNVSDIFSNLAGDKFGDASDRIKEMKEKLAKGMKKVSRDIKVAVTVSLEEAINGTVKKVSIKRKEDGEEKTSVLSLAIPKNAYEGMTLKLTGKGKTVDGETGNLFVKIKVAKEHPDFEIQELNTVSTLYVNIGQAVLGDEVKVKTLHGEETVSIPQGVESGTKISVKGKGIKGKEGMGDHIVEVKVKMPTNLTEEQVTIFEKLKTIDVA